MLQLQKEELQSLVGKLFESIIDNKNIEVTKYSNLDTNKLYISINISDNCYIHLNITNKFDPKNVKRISYLYKKSLSSIKQIFNDIQTLEYNVESGICYINNYIPFQ